MDTRARSEPPKRSRASFRGGNIDIKRKMNRARIECTNDVSHNARGSPPPLSALATCAMGMQTAGVTQLAGASGCAKVSQKALACAWCPTPLPEQRAHRPTPRRGFGTLDRSFVRVSRVSHPPPPTRRRRRARREQGEDVRRAVQGVQGVPESRERGDCPATKREQERHVLGLMTWFVRVSESEFRLKFAFYLSGHAAEALSTATHIASQNAGTSMSTTTSTLRGFSGL